MSMNTKVVLVALSLALLLLVSCAPKQIPTPEMHTAPSVETGTKATTTAAASIVETSSANVEQIDKDLDITELDSLDTDLAAVDSLDLG